MSARQVDTDTPPVGGGAAAPRLQALPAPGDGWKTLLAKEVLRFWRVAFQTIAAPVLTSVLYLMIFGHVLSDRVQVYPGVSYVAFLVPGLVMMSVLQNAFANSASSLVQSKIMGNLVFQLLTPLSAWNWFLAYVGAAVARGLLVGLGVYAITLFYAPPQAAAPLWVLVFALLGAGLMGVLGVLAGLWSDKFDQMAVFQNFIVMPMTFLAGVFYSVHSLPGMWRAVSHFNPFFYMVDGLRYGFFGASDVSPWLSLAVAGGSFAALSALTLHLLRTGYKLRY
jgi:ABC-2 type transport system permease protein